MSCMDNRIVFEYFTLKSAEFKKEKKFRIFCGLDCAEH